ncbi:FtsK/SpoIIIE domain-containing protein [Pseudoclavibacter helvolus]|uniref:FtsK/SpoIIIE domain-containing protein n=1 Tax=Pseudoclavibacter helvolus TaxID=255205 RepID=UPI003C71D916
MANPQQQYIRGPAPIRQSWGNFLLWKLVIAAVTWPFILILSALVGYRPSAVDARRFTGERGRWPVLTWVSVALWVSGLMAVLFSLLLTPVSLVVSIPLMLLTAARVAAAPYGLPLGELNSGVRDLWAVGPRWRKAAQISLGALALAALLGVVLYAGASLYWNLPGWLELVALGAVVLAVLVGLFYMREVGARHRDDVQEVVRDQHQLAAAVAGLFGIQAERVLEQGMIQPLGDGGYALAPVPGPVSLRGQEDMEQRVAQLLPDLTVTAFEPGRIVLGPAPEEVLDSRAIMAQSGGLIVGVQDETDTELRPKAVRWTLAPGTSPAAAPQAAALARGENLALVEWNPYEGYAIAAKLSTQTAQLRARLAELARCQPWEIELAAEYALNGALSKVTLLRAPVIEDTAKRAETWQARIQQLVPAISKTRWSVADNSALDGTIAVSRAVDPLAAVQPYPFDAAFSLKAVPLGVFADGRQMSMALLSSNVLLGGIPGGGKSGGMTALLAGVSRLENVAIVGIDPKRVELPLWRSRFSLIVKTEEHASAVLDTLLTEMEKRYEWLEEHELKKLDVSSFSPERPLIVLVIDELAEIVGIALTPEEKKAEGERIVALRRLVSKGRAAGIVVFAATQKPESKVIPTELRDLIAQRVAYATTTPEMSDTILGKGMSNLGGDAHGIAQVERGVCYVVTEESRKPQRARTYWIPDEDVKGIAESTAHLRVDLPWLDKVSAAKPKFGQVIAEDTVEYDDSIVEEASDLDFSDFNPSDFE